MKKFRGNSQSRVHYRPLSKAQQRLNHALAAEKNVRIRTIGRRGEMNRSIIAEFAKGNIERTFHATKGLRVRHSVPA